MNDTESTVLGKIAGAAGSKIALKDTLQTKGKKLGRIVHGQPATTNMAFGGDDWKTLFFTNRDRLGSVNVKIPGMPVPAVKKT